MSQYLRAYAERAADGGKMGSPIRYVASTENVARDGMIITADAWELENFRKNPVVLFGHDYFSRPPIGRVTNVEVRDNQLIADVEFDQTDEFAVMCERKARSGVMAACSVGWNTLSFEPPNGPNAVPRVTKAELLDFSVVPVPSDPDALKARQKRGLEAMAHDLLKAIEPEEPANTSDTVTVTVTEAFDPSAARTTWDEDAPQMMRLFSPFAQRPDEERRKDYARLARAYSRHGKTPPEFLPQADIDALGEEELRGLFLAGEPETFADVFVGMTTRAGAVLSQRNRRTLEEIRGMATSIADMCDEMMASAAKQAKSDDADDDDERGAEGPLSDLLKVMGIAA